MHWFYKDTGDMILDLKALMMVEDSQLEYHTLYGTLAK